MPINIKLAIPFISIIAFAWLLSGDWLEIISRLKKNIVIILLIAFWGLHVIGLAYTKNMYYGLVDLQQKLSFVVFPIFFLSSIHRIFPYKQWFLHVFLFGCFVSGIYMIINALFLSLSIVDGSFIFNPSPPDAWWENYFRYNRLSVFHHTSYLAMYFSLSIAILFGYIKEKGRKWRIVVSIAGILFFYILIILLSSKAGILVGTLTIIIGSFWLLFKNYKALSVIVSLVFILVTGYLLFQYNWRFIKLNDNIESIVDSSNGIDAQDGKTDMRIQIWRSIPSIIDQNWLFGFGTGDTKDELVAGYKRLNMTDAAEQQFNAHNQYLETLLALGLPGLLLLLLLLFYPVYLFFKREFEFLHVIFIGILAINLLFESMLVRIAGVMFFSIFYSLFFTRNIEK